jgi:hypothetical protein
VFALQPEDGVSEVLVKRLKLRIMGSDRRITLEVAAKRDTKEIYSLLESVIKGLEVPDSILKVRNVGLQLIFPGAGTRREERFPFSVSHPNSCSLRSGDPKHEVAKQLLRRWKLDVSGDPKDDPEEHGQPAQRVIHT